MRVEFSISLNVKRRHLTAGQLAAVAYAALPLYEAEAAKKDACRRRTDRDRADVAAQLLSVVPGVPATTAGSLARRFGPVQLGGVEAGNAALAARVFGLLSGPRRDALSSGGVTIDMDLCCV